MLVVFLICCWCVYVFLSVGLFLCLSVCFSVSSSVRPSVRLSVCPAVCLSVGLSVCRSVCLSGCLSAFCWLTYVGVGCAREAEMLNKYMFKAWTYRMCLKTYVLGAGSKFYVLTSTVNLRPWASGFEKLKNPTQTQASSCLDSSM